MTPEQPPFNLDEFNAFQQLISQGKLTNLTYLLPSLLQWDAKPYTLIDHFPFESLFSTQMTVRRCYRTARQVAKSTSICARGVMLSALIPRFKSLYVTPLYDQVRRLSGNYFRPLVEQSPIRHLLIDRTCENNVLQRTFKNQSRVHFGYALLSADRLRGLNLDRCNFDEAQDIDHTLIPIITEALSHSEYGITEFTGTPKTKDGNLEVWWDKSSQAEWVIRCGCGHWNIPAIDHDLDRMIGLEWENVSEDRPGTICAKCGSPIFPRQGHWIHRFPERQYDFCGYHIPQVIMPLHYARPEKWRLLLSKMKGAGNMAIGTFYNENLGEAYDNATKLVSKPELERAGCLHENTEENALKVLDNYTLTALGIDWGGGGEDGVSLTAVAVLGLRPNGTIDCIHGKKLYTPHDHNAEAHECLRLFRTFRCSLFAHDYSGAGELRQTIMVQHGLPLDKIISIQYLGPGLGGVMTPHLPTATRPLPYWTVDKTRSLQYTCYALKFNILRFFKYDHKGVEEPGLLHDFLALIENKISTSRSNDRYTIQKSKTAPDDFAQAVNVGCCAIWDKSGAWPTFASIESAGAAVRELAQRSLEIELAHAEQFAGDMPCDTADSY